MDRSQATIETLEGDNGITYPPPFPPTSTVFALIPHTARLEGEGGRHLVFAGGQQIGYFLEWLSILSLSKNL